MIKLTVDTNAIAKIATSAVTGRCRAIIKAAQDRDAAKYGTDVVIVETAENAVRLFATNADAAKDQIARATTILGAAGVKVGETDAAPATK